MVFINNLFFLLNLIGPTFISRMFQGFLSLFGEIEVVNLGNPIFLKSDNWVKYIVQEVEVTDDDVSFKLEKDLLEYKVVFSKFLFAQQKIMDKISKMEELVKNGYDFVPPFEKVNYRGSTGILFQYSKPKLEIPNFNSDVLNIALQLNANNLDYPFTSQNILYNKKIYLDPGKLELKNSRSINDLLKSLFILFVQNTLKVKVDGFNVATKLFLLKLRLFQNSNDFELEIIFNFLKKRVQLPFDIFRKIEMLEFVNKDLKKENLELKKLKRKREDDEEPIRKKKDM